MIEDAAHIAALRCGQVAHAGLDVYDGEPPPHLGSATASARQALRAIQALGDGTLDGILAVLRGEHTGNRVA